MRKYKGLGVGGFCIPEPSLGDKVTYRDMELELQRLRAAITLLASRLGNELSTVDAGRILDLLKPPCER
jgi:hypothetical protein